MSIVASLKKFLKENGFEKYEGSSTYFKVFRNKYYAIAEIYRDTNHVVYNRLENCFYNTNRCFYDIHIDIWHETLNDGRSKKVILTNYNAGNSICQLSKTNELKWVNFDGCTEHRIVEEIKNAFNNTFYNPLFFNENDISIYDYLCKLDMIRCGTVFYNSRLLKLAALDEKRYDEALFCLKCTLISCFLLADNIKDCEAPNFTSVNLLTDTLINRMRDDNNADVKLLIEEYDYIVNMMKLKQK
ncbi:MAG: hypothetical protein IKI97_07280 [Clostridia bacterium]|jgi:hypothetical protein|nr:hypothetical protein [Clostridia bacterium]